MCIKYKLKLAQDNRAKLLGFLSSLVNFYCAITLQYVYVPNVSDQGNKTASVLFYDHVYCQQKLRI